MALITTLKARAQHGMQAAGLTPRPSEGSGYSSESCPRRFGLDPPRA